ncbi:RDD family protein [Puia dinghuensis]|uniref:RDD domain-containing protein n=1 Tax=Puia dinghuensis TaxID=1792502 RepID=A0A8J2UHP3_9BACT|nr:RDD family protein [Puia dinghuensis]GGB19600.1 hypothetical protein GCM10011511_49170 [Puia dinghuensis]
MENTYIPPDENPNILDDVDYDLVQANGGKRFGNWIVDRIVLWGIWRIFNVTIGPIFLARVYSVDDNSFTIFMKAFLIALVPDLLLMALIEFAGRGKTIGKFLTGTRAVNEDGTQITFKTALLRSLVRVVPFEPFSALGNPSYPWHDRWTKTYVIDERLSRLPVK